MQSITVIISTGRTGTQFFEHFINKNSTNAFCLHEPSPSRRFKFFSNMFLQGKLKGQYITQQYTKHRKKITSNEKLYIESNNFLFGCIEPLSKEFDLKVLHIIRDPRTYIQSHLKHGFWHGHKRFFAKYIPFWLELLNMDKKDKNNPIKVLAQRWLYVNNIIETYSKTMPYLVIRFEDLFSNDTEVAKSSLLKAIDFLGLNTNDNLNLSDSLREKQNIGTKKKVSSSLIETEHEYINKTCKELMTKFNYVQ